MITGSKTDGVKVTISTDSNGGARISNDALQAGCGRGAGSAATTFISGALICLLCGISAHLSPLQKRATPLQL
jgi:hypothetical protein